MFKPSGNPKVLELTKTWTKRSVDLTQLKKIQVPEGKFCAWCAQDKLSGNQKYCSNACKVSANAWAYPQKEYGLGCLLMRQDWKCNVCQYDYVPLVEQLLVNGRIYDKPKDYKTMFSWTLVRRIKQKSPQERKPEVDHIIPVSKGGITLGISNHQALCFSCHKAKTKIDNSGSRKSKV